MEGRNLVRFQFAATEAQGLAYHIPVMLHEAVEALNIEPEGVYVDCTFGGGGHSRAILAQLGPGGKLVAFDQDADAAANLPSDPRLVFVPENFRHLNRFLRLYGFEKVNGILADLGVSSHQFDQKDRGFSYRGNALLDMRMDQRQATTAAHILNRLDGSALQQLFSAYGEVSNAKTLAAAVVASRQHRPFETVQQLMEVLEPLARGNKFRYFSQVFQALRIEVNQELVVLKEWLEQVPNCLVPGGRVAVITFHSLEDRLVKQFFKNGSFTLEEDPVYGNKTQSPLRLVNKKPIEATVEEIKRNERSRSARLRIAVRK